MSQDTQTDVSTLTTESGREADEYIDRISGLNSQTATMEERIDACRKLVSYGRHWQLEEKWTLDEDDHPKPGNAMSLYLPKTQARGSVCDENGCRVSCHIVQSDGNIKTDHYWVCLHKNCVKDQLLGASKHLVPIFGTTSSNATKHLKEVHGIVSKKTKNAKMNADAFQTLVKDANPGYVANPARFLRNIMGIAACQHAVPFAFFKSTAWNVAMHHLPVPGAGRTLQNIDIRQPILEQYLYMRSKIKSEIARVKKWYGVPCFCLIVDLYKSPINKVKMLCFRLAWANPFTGNTSQYNIGCMEYSPSLEARRSLDANKLLIAMVNHVLEDFGISEDDILTASTDFGPDVRCASRQVATYLEWCFGHMEVSKE